MNKTVWIARDADGSLCVFLKKPRLFANGTFYDKSMVAVNREFLKDFEWVSHNESPVEFNVSITKKDVIQTSPKHQNPHSHLQ